MQKSVKLILSDNITMMSIDKPGNRVFSSEIHDAVLHLKPELMQRVMIRKWLIKSTTNPASRFYKCEFIEMLMQFLPDLRQSYNPALLDKILEDWREFTNKYREWDQHYHAVNVRKLQRDFPKLDLSKIDRHLSIKMIHGQPVVNASLSGITYIGQVRCTRVEISSGIQQHSDTHAMKNRITGQITDLHNNPIMDHLPQDYVIDFALPCGLFYGKLLSQFGNNPNGIIVDINTNNYIVVPEIKYYEAQVSDFGQVEDITFMAEPMRLSPYSPQCHNAQAVRYYFFTIIEQMPLIKMTTVAAAVLELRPDFVRRLQIIEQFCNICKNTNDCSYFRTIPRDICDIIQSYLPDLRQTQIANKTQAYEDYENFITKFGFAPNIPSIQISKLVSSDDFKRTNMTNCTSLDQSVSIKIVDEQIYIYPENNVEYYHGCTRISGMEKIIGKNEPKIIIGRTIVTDSDPILHILPCGLLCVQYYSQSVRLLDVNTKKYIDITNDYMHKRTKLSSEMREYPIEVMLDDFGDMTIVNKNAINLSQYSPKFLRLLLV